MKNFVIVGLLAFGLFSCAGFTFGSGHTEQPVAPLVITETSNVTAESLKNQQSVVIPIETLGGDVGDALKGEFERRGTQPVITTKDHLTNAAGAMVVTLDANATQEVLSPNVISLIANVFGSTIPGSAPWMQLLIVILPFLSSRFRKHTVTAVRRIVPGVEGPNQDGKVPDFDDLREAVIDLTKAVTLAPKESQDVIVKQKNQEIMHD
jgi:hypothetical protein